jgi:CRP/FNR family transcriptional regulator, cyclic AMP receptor protein
MKKSRILKFNKQEQIIKKGDEEQKMYVILKGSVEIVINDGVKSLTLATLFKNDFFGEISLINNTPRSADVFATTKTIVTYIANMEELDIFLEKNPFFARKMVKILTERLSKTDEILKNQLSGKNKTKLMNFRW